MSRKYFLLFVGCVAVAIGLFALTLPTELIVGKAVASDELAAVWVREVGVLLLAIGVLNLLARNLADSPELKLILFFDLLVQLGLFPIELLAYSNGTLTNLSGVAPNTILHLVLTAGFTFYLSKIKTSVSVLR